MSTRIFSLLSLFIILCQSCQEYEVEGEKTVATKWVPAFLKYDSFFKFGDKEKLEFCYKFQKDKLKFDEQVYPPYFGGVYVSSPEKKLVVLLTDTSKIIRNDLIQLCSLTSDGIDFNICKYSLNELLKVQSQIDNIPNFVEKCNPSSVEVEKRNNRVVVVLKGTRDENKIEYIESFVSDPDMLTFKFIEFNESVSQKSSRGGDDYDYKLLEKAPFPYDAQPGMEFFDEYTDKLYRGSIGFPVVGLEIQGMRVPGFVTAAHCVRAKSYLYFNTGNGYAPFAHWLRNDDLLDVAVCIILPQSCKFTSSLSSQFRYACEGDEVRVKGAHSDHSGIITSVSVYQYSAGRKYVCCKVEGSSYPFVQEGDSGGYVEQYDCPVGMLIGRAGDYRSAFFIDACMILERLNLTLISL